MQFSVHVEQMTRTICAVCYAWAHVTGSELMAFLYLLMCNSGLCVVRKSNAIYRNTSSLCRILCLRRMISYQILTLQF